MSYNTLPDPPISDEEAHMLLGEFDTAQDSLPLPLRWGKRALSILREGFGNVGKYELFCVDDRITGEAPQAPDLTLAEDGIERSFEIEPETRPDPTEALFAGLKPSRITVARATLASVRQEIKPFESWGGFATARYLLKLAQEPEEDETRLT